MVVAVAVPVPELPDGRLALPAAPPSPAAGRVPAAEPMPAAEPTPAAEHFLPGVHREALPLPAAAAEPQSAVAAAVLPVHSALLLPVGATQNGKGCATQRLNSPLLSSCITIGSDAHRHLQVAGVFVVEDLHVFFPDVIDLGWNSLQVQMRNGK